MVMQVYTGTKGVNGGYHMMGHVPSWVARRSLFKFPPIRHSECIAVIRGVVLADLYEERDVVPGEKEDGRRKKEDGGRRKEV